MTVSRWWNERSSPQRLDLYIRWGLYIAFVTWSASATLLALSAPVADPVSVVAFLVVAILQAVACLALLRAGLGNLLGGPRLDRRLFGVAVALTAVGVVAGLWAFPDADVTDIQPIMFFLGALTAALTPVLSRRAMYSGIMLGAAVTTVFYASIDGGDWAGALQFGVFYLLGVGIFVLVSRLSVWMLVLVWEIEESRAVQTRLAVAEERLRFARDFHDVLGRNLTLIAVTSDLAAQLARRGDPQAVDRMLDVRGIAHESAREVREVVAGYRAADLDAELAGARSVLRAAGIGTRVIGDSSSVSGDAQAAFAWVLREATTNVIRHSNARTCKIELGVQPTSGAGGHGCAAVLRVRNDGARAADSQHAAGHGLAGLGERVTALGGQIIAGAEPGGWFTVEARLPVTEHAPVVAVESTP